MRKSIVFFSLSLFGLLLAASLVFSPALAQSDGIPEQQTVEAAVQGLFTATAQAEAYSTLGLTVEVAFQAAQTATAEAGTGDTASPTETPPGLNEMTMTDAARILTATQVGATTATAVLDMIPLTLRDALTELVFINAGQPFEMGTTPQEVQAAVDQCVNIEGGNCILAFGEDSFPPHSVTVSPFQIERTEVTYAQYLAFLNLLGAGSHLTGCDGQMCAVTQAEDENSSIAFDGFNYNIVAVIENLPVTGVTWHGAKAYCEAVGRRLPTEAEWEFAARGYTGFIYPWGNNWDPALAKTSVPPGQPGALPVGSFIGGASPWGILDMAGNVAEWVNDWYLPEYYQTEGASGLNPTGPAAGTERVIRGGSWDAKPFFARTVHRQSAPPTTTGSWLGFRCAADAAIVDGTFVAPSPIPTSTRLPTISPPSAETETPGAIEATPTATPT
jgi:sulfatase modifying factor 1